jgi:hypothetical protein
MPKTTPVFVGLDVHKETISVAYAAGGTAEPPQFVGQIGTRQCDVDKLVRRLQARSSQLVSLMRRPVGADPSPAPDR